MISTLLRALAVTLVGSTAVVAADIPTTGVPVAPIAPVFTWTGFYAGVNAGYGWGDTDITANPLPTPALFGSPVTRVGQDIDGFLGGVQAGFNYQAGAFVVGLEADFQLSDIAESSRFNFAAGNFALASTSIDWFGTLRARAGFVPTERLLVYATGGLIYASVSTRSDIFLNGGSGVPQFTYSGSSDEVEFGWTLGGGLEFAATNNVTLRAEYLYYDLGETSHVGFPRAPNPPFAFRNDYETDGHIVRAAVNYKF